MRDFFADIDWSGWSGASWTTGVRVIQRLIGPAIRASISAQMVGQPAGEVQKRIDTLSHVAYRTLGVIGVLVVLITVLPEFGINVGALLAGGRAIGAPAGPGGGRRG